MRLRRRVLIVAAVAMLAFGGVVWRHTAGWAQWDGEVEDLQVDLGQPDALVSTRSLSALPRELLRVPLLRDLLTEDFVFYYEDHPDRLGLRGSIRRIAYEHDLRWSDEALAWALDSPAEVALWRSASGSLDHWMVAFTRQELAGLMREAATVALKDSHLKQASSVVVDGSDVAVYALEYGSRRTLLLASLGDRVVVLSHPGLLLDPQRAVRPDAQTVVAGLLAGDPGVLRRAFSLPEATAEHSLAVRMHYLSFGYQRFFPALEALRFDFGGGAWSTHALLDGTAFPGPAPWSAVPTGAALCALLPVDWGQGRALASAAPPEVAPALEALSQELEGPAAACWYGEGRLQAPLVVAALRGERPDAHLAAVFEWAITRPAESAPAVARAAGGVHLWARELQVPFAAADDGGRPQPGPLTVTLATAGRHVFFSPDRERVERALDTAARRYPSLAESLPEAGLTLGLVAPRALSELGRKEALVMLPRADEPVFRTAAERHLLPRLEALAGYPSYRLALAGPPAAGRSWNPVAWEETKR